MLTSSAQLAKMFSVLCSSNPKGDVFKYLPHAGDSLIYFLSLNPFLNSRFMHTASD